MIEVRKTRLFEDWFVSLRDQQARLRVQVRIDRLAFGNPGQHRVLTGGVCEMKIDHGPGYRVYFGKDGATIAILLGGGTKKRQQRDIEAARARWADYRWRKRSAR